MNQTQSISVWRALLTVLGFSVIALTLATITFITLFLATRSPDMADWPDHTCIFLQFLLISVTVISLPPAISMGFFYTAAPSNTTLACKPSLRRRILSASSYGAVTHGFWFSVVTFSIDHSMSYSWVSGLSGILYGALSGAVCVMVSGVMPFFHPQKKHISHQ